MRGSFRLTRWVGAILAAAALTIGGGMAARAAGVNLPLLGAKAPGAAAPPAQPRTAPDDRNQNESREAPEAQETPEAAEPSETPEAAESAEPYEANETAEPAERDEHPEASESHEAPEQHDTDSKDSGADND
jgi:hypothetical protein